MYDIAAPIFKLVNSEVDNILKLGLDHQFPQLSSLYTNTRDGLKEQMGTSAGWPWLGEYIVFYTLKKHLQRMLDCTFSFSTINGFFVDHKENPKYRLVHDGKLQLDDSKDVSPDIYLYKISGKKLIFTIDVKVTITWSGRLNTALSKLKRTINDSRWELDKPNRPLRYLMCLDTLFPSNYKKVHKYLQKGVSIVGPQNSSIESKLKEGDYPMVTFTDCISQIQLRL